MSKTLFSLQVLYQVASASFSTTKIGIIFGCIVLSTKDTYLSICPNPCRNCFSSFVLVMLLTSAI